MGVRELIILCFSWLLRLFFQALIDFSLPPRGQRGVPLVILLLKPKKKLSPSLWYADDVILLSSRRVKVANTMIYLRYLK